MKTWIVSAFGRELFKVEVAERVTIDDVMRQMMMNGAEIEYEDLAEGLIPCESCGEMFDPDEDDTEARFADMTERLVWDASEDYPEPPPEMFSDDD